MPLTIQLVLIFLISFQGIASLEPPLLDKEQYYEECLEWLSNLPFEDNYDQLLICAENNQKTVSKHSTLGQTIAEFAETILKRIVQPEEIISFNGQAGKGLSGNPIFKVGTAPNSTLVVKAFKGGSGDFSKEFLTLYTYNQSNLSDLRFPHIQGIGTTEINQERYFLIGMQFVDGLTVDDLFITFFHSDQNPEEQGRLLGLLQQMYIKMGKGLSQLHTHKRDFARSVPPIHLKGLEKLIIAANAALSSRPEGFFLAQRLQTVSNSKEWLEIPSQKFDLGYIHGDVHPGNFIANPNSEALYLIDTGTETIGSDGAPIGLPFMDIAQLYNALSLRKIWGLSDEAANSLFSSFTQAYTSRAPFPNKRQMFFFQIIDTLNFFVWYDLIEGTLNQPSRETIKQMYQYRLEKCHELLSDFSSH